MTNKNKKPYWWPVKVDADWCEELRQDYSEASGLSDEEIIQKYNDGNDGFSETWDHLGDARDDYFELATAFLKLVEESGKKPEDFK